MKTRAQMIEEAGCPPLGRYVVYWTVKREELDRLIAIVAEEAAKVCEEAADAAYESWRMCADPADQGAEIQANKLAAAIRERFKQEQGLC